MRPKYIFTIIIFLAVAISVMTLNSTQRLGVDKNLLNVKAVTADSTSNQSNTIRLDASKGQEIGAIYEAFLSPHQEPGEEENTPALTPKVFRSTAPSVARNQRKSRGHGVIRFAKDLSKVYVDVRVEGINAKDVNMFHIHCGRPDTLGPILIDFANSGNIQENISDGTFSVELTNEDVEKVANSRHGHNVVAAFTSGCPIEPGLPGKVKTIAGMEQVARRGELYFNLHTKGQTYYGEMRGQLRPAGNQSGNQ
ncbi:MAG: CHRD domain-containing protein [Blastocatellia bacterium]|nr:CHRD domain-containing protein [Blastocatellia bacterium]